MGIYTKDNGKKEKNMGKANCFRKIVILIMRGNGKMGRKMEKEFKKYLRINIMMGLM